MDGCNNESYCKVNLLFKARVADEARHYPLGKISYNFRPDPYPGVDYLHLYSDIIQPNRLARQIVNVLAIFPYGGSNDYYTVLKP